MSLLLQNRARIEAKIRTVLETRLASRAKAADGDTTLVGDDAPAEDQDVGRPRVVVADHEALEGDGRAAPVDDTFTVAQILGQPEGDSREV